MHVCICLFMCACAWLAQDLKLVYLFYENIYRCLNIRHKFCMYPHMYSGIAGAQAGVPRLSGHLARLDAAKNRPPPSA